MGYGTDGLTFNSLRGANCARLPQFKNSKGQPAHAKPDGSDWTPAQWFQAMFGEVGEVAEVRYLYECGLLTRKAYEDKIKKEVPDIQIYLDLMAKRFLDEVPKVCELKEMDAAQTLMKLVMHLGCYANERKKYDRGDISRDEFEQRTYGHLGSAGVLVTRLLNFNYHANNPTLSADPDGINLGQATMDKFNQTSVKVGSNVRLDADDWHYTTENKA